jgi:hypothetical protein
MKAIPLGGFGAALLASAASAAPLNATTIGSAEVSNVDQVGLVCNVGFAPEVDIPSESAFDPTETFAVVQSQCRAALLKSVSMSPGQPALAVDAHQHVVEDKWRRGRRVAAAASREDTHIDPADAGAIAL